MTALRALLLLIPFAGLLVVGGTAAQVAAPVPGPGETRQALAEAQAEGARARARAEALEREAAGAAVAAERTAQESAALAARIQQAEAEIASHEARARLVGQQRAVLRASLAERQRPLVRLTAALQRIARRPAALSLLRPGSLEQTVHLRAVLESMLPEVQRRTQALRAEIERGRALQLQAEAAALALRRSQGDLTNRRARLATIETGQRLASRVASGNADRETERALALAEQARDLSGLVGELTRAGALRDQLAALPGPVMRPPLPQASQVMRDAAPLPATPARFAPLRFVMPVAGRLVVGFGEATSGKPRSRGLAIAARSGAQAVAPGAGRVAFAGPYQGYGQIVIIEHGDGWTSLVTGLGVLDTAVGRSLVAGSPLGRAGPGQPVITLELRNNGEPANPLDYLKG
jgi:septal ring factor EnvC (AmiA/AmiB activator)